MRMGTARSTFRMASCSVMLVGAGSSSLPALVSASQCAFELGDRLLEFSQLTDRSGVRAPRRGEGGLNLGLVGGDRLSGATRLVTAAAPPRSRWFDVHSWLRNASSSWWRLGVVWG